MMRYKLTDENMITHGGCQWALGEWRDAPGEGELCGPGWIHVYDHPLVGVFLNPIHADFRRPRLFKCETEGRELDDNGLKRGVQRCRLLREIPLPEITVEQRIEIAIRCSQRVCRNVAWNAWADGWLSGADRSVEAAAAATWSAWSAASAWSEWSMTAARAARAAEAAASAWVTAKAWAARAAEAAEARAAASAMAAEAGASAAKAAKAKAKAAKAVTLIDVIHDVIRGGKNA